MAKYFLSGAASGLVTQGLAHGLSGFGTNHLMAGISTLDGECVGNIKKNGLLKPDCKVGSTAGIRH